MLNRWTQRLQSTWGARGRRLPTSQHEASPLRTEIRPPERLYQASQWRGSLRDWLNTGWSISSPAPLSIDRATSASSSEPTSFANIRLEFAEALNDIDTEPAASLRSQIELAESPRELWHLRSPLYSLVARHYSESQAQSRMERLNRHFAHRAMRPGSAPR